MNEDFLSNMALSSPEKASQFAAIALKDINTRLIPMKQYLDDGNFVAAGDNAHAMKSVALNVGAVEFSETCKSIEHLCKAEEKMQECQNLCMELLSSFPALEKELKKFIIEVP